MTAPFEIIESRERLERLAAQWRELAVADGNAFTSPEWFGSTVDGARDGSSQPFVAVLVADDGSLEALLPLVRDGRRVIRFAGAELGDRFAPVARSAESAQRVCDEMASLLRRRRDWSSLILENVESTDRWPSSFANGLNVARLGHREEVAPFAVIGGLDWDAWLASRSRNFRSQLGRKQRALERAHAVEFCLARSAEEVDASLESFRRLHLSRWDPRGGSAAVTDRSSSAHREFAHAALAQGWLRLWTLEVDGAAVAAWYGWHVGQRYAYYLGGFDPEWERHSVGFLLQAHTIRHAISEGASVYDLLVGGESYKRRFAEEESSLSSYVVTRRFSKARLATAGEKIARAAADQSPPAVRRVLKRSFGRLARRSHSSVER